MKSGRLLSTMAILAIGLACTGQVNRLDVESSGAEAELAARSTAEGFFRGVYGCDPALIDRNAADGVEVSYPIFESLFETPVIRGREAVKQFSEGFCSRWIDPEITVHEAVVQADRVVLLWECSATPAPAATGDARPGPRESWGGISFIRLDSAGKVIVEVGEESSPGPIARMQR